MSSLTSFKESVAVQNNALPRAADDGAADAAMAVPLFSYSRRITVHTLHRIPTGTTTEQCGSSSL